MNAREANAIFSRAIFEHQPPKRRETPTSKRQAIAKAQIEALVRAIERIRRRIRETPQWATAYNSAITAIELEIQEIRNG